MMKRAFPRALALILVLLMTLSLSGCGLFAGRLAISAVRMSKLSSLRMDLDTDFSMSMSMFGEDLDLDLSVTGPMEFTLSPLRGKAALRLDMLGESMELLSYLERSGNSLLVYNSFDNGATWEKQVLETENVSAGDGISAKTIAGLAKLSSDFRETGTETIRGAEAIVYQGSVSVADLKQNLDFSAFLASVEESTGIKLDENDFDLDSIEPVPVTLCISRHGNMPVRFSVGLTGLTQAVVPVVVQAAMKSAMAESPLGSLPGLDGLNPAALGIDFSVNRLVVTADLYDFDDVAEITIPPEALAAETAA